MTWFLLFIVVNTVLMACIIRQRGLFSAEGLGVAFLALGFTTDALGLLLIYFFDLGLMNVDAELELRFLPNIMLFVALVAFYAGLAVSDSDMSVTEAPIADEKRRRVLFLGYLLTGAGVSAKLYALYAWGFRSVGDYFSGLYMYQATKRGGEFFDKGLDLALIGLSILIAYSGKNVTKKVLCVAALFFFSFILSPSKSGINSAIITLFVTLYSFNRPMIRGFTRPAFILIAAAIFFVGLGVKTQVKYQYSKDDSAISLSGGDIYLNSVASLGTRMGPFGLYRGYSFMVNRMTDDHTLFMGTGVLGNVLTSWVPRFLWPDKPGHPFNSRGDLIKEDQSIDVYGNEAPTFVGSVFADAGLLSLVPYSLAAGFIFGFLRKVSMLKSGHDYLLRIGYVFFAMQMGNAFAESGVLNIVYFTVFTAALVFTLYVAVLLMDTVFSPTALAESGVDHG